MKALRLNAPNDLELCDIPIPKPGQNEVVCKVESVSICGTDPHIIAGEYPGFWPKEFPLIPGHEWSGVVAELGERSACFGWNKGDRVCGISHCGCGQCAMCMEGRYNLCLNFGENRLGHRQYGHYTQGAYAEYICTSIKSIAVIPGEMGFDEASCMDPLSIALHAVMRSGIQPGDSVLINGAGSQGLLAILCAQSMGAGRIMISGSGSRLKAAKTLGTVDAVDYRSEDVVRNVREMTGGLGAARVIECTGTAAGFRNACEAVAAGGCVSVISLPKEDVAIPLRRLVLNEVTVAGNRANPNTLRKAISIAQRYKNEISRLITHRFPMSEYKEAFRVFNGRLDDSIKVVLKPQE